MERRPRGVPPASGRWRVRPGGGPLPQNGGSMAGDRADQAHSREAKKAGDWRPAEELLATYLGGSAADGRFPRDCWDVAMTTPVVIHWQNEHTEQGETSHTAQAGTGAGQSFKDSRDNPRARARPTTPGQSRSDLPSGTRRAPATGAEGVECRRAGYAAGRPPRREPAEGLRDRWRGSEGQDRAKHLESLPKPS